MLVLGIESSCDETAAALVEDGRTVLSNVVASQVETHRSFGGVVPELASREHLRNIGFVIRKAFGDAGRNYDQIDGIAVTQGPGLIGSLLVGVSYAKAMAFALEKALVPVNHIEGHIFSAFIEHTEIPYPLLALAVSGGHTSLIFSPEPERYQLVARTRDDAAGEALDKLAKFLGLGYPGGPVIDRLAQQGDPRSFHFSIPKISDGSLDFSFSGFKTAALRHIEQAGIRPCRSVKKVPQKVLDLVASYQQAIIDTLVMQTTRAMKKHHPQSILLVGGVACNSLLRRTFTEVFEAGGKCCRVYYPSPMLTTDNAAMIAAAGTPKLRRGAAADLNLNAFADLPLC
jgi:N6-L-threonylcarbamoyladenine synthase